MLMVCKALLRELRTAWHIITWVWAEAGNRASKTRCHKATPWKRSWKRMQAWSWLTFFAVVVVDVVVVATAAVGGLQAPGSYRRCL